VLVNTCDDRAGMHSTSGVSKTFSLFVVSINQSIEVGDNPDLHNLGQKDKIVILKILAEAWRREKTFKKRVAAEIPSAKKATMGEILFALFGHKILTCVKFKLTKKNRFQVRLNLSSEECGIPNVIKTYTPNL
jgi:hypothetical protein